jgi:hypothetical protein
MWSRAVARLFRHSYGRYGDCGSLPQEGDGLIMRHFIVIGVAAASLGGCSSFSLDAFKSEPPTVQLQLDSVPSGAEARTSTGQSCKTPCSVAVVPPDAGFSVTYTLNKFLPATIPVQVIRIPGDFSTPATTTIDPNPVVAELQPAGPPPKGARKKEVKPKTPKPPKGTPSPAGSPFPNPSQPAPSATPTR